MSRSVLSIPRVNVARITAPVRAAIVSVARMGRLKASLRPSTRKDGGKTQSGCEPGRT
jgi:hypothetical protein